jgi:surfactin synthase thioesterase subunit
MIAWTDNISEDVTIDLYKGGAFHSAISTPTPSNGSFDWTIPFTQESGTDYTVKITSVDNPATVFDFTDSNFTIVANQITVTSPNGGENWLASEEQIITWSDNLTGSVELQLFKNDVFHSSIVTSTPSDGEYTWNIAATTPSASDYKVKIISVEDGGISDLSDSNFTIISNELTVVTPNGGESWLTSSAYDITWVDDISGDVKIDLYKAGLFDSEIAASAPSNGTFSWNIPGTVATGSDYKVRITSVDQPVLYDMSDANFTIFTGGITVISPNGGESWQAGSSQVVAWADNINEDVTIDLYKGGVFHSAISTPTASDGSFDWVVPFNQESGTDYTVKITSVDNPATVFDFSDSNFTIIPSQITVTSPNGGENWLASTSEEIIWTDNIDGDVEIQLFKGGIFLTSISTSTPSDGSFTWNIPTSLVQSSDYKVRISSVFDGNIKDLSDEDFTISNEIIVTAPNGLEIWQTGTIQNITWTDNFDGDVKIELFKTGVFHSEITPSTPSDGSFSWDIPESILDGLDYTIKITSLDNVSVFDFSDGDFEIFNVNITIISPNGGENWQAGTSQNIIWSDNISTNVLIDLYKGGVFHSVISAATESDGSYNWDIPFILESGTDYTVKITSVDGPGIFDSSDSTFTVIGNLVTVTSPNGGENWLVTEDQMITWTDNFTGSVEIQLFKNDLFHSSIVTSTPSDGEFTWNIPDNTPSGSDYKVKIISVDDGSVSDQSDANFTIISSELAVNKPNGGESWLTNSAYDITWTDDISGDVKIDLYKAGVFDSEVTAATESDGIFNWNIPATVATGSDYKIQITSVDQPVLYDESNANFTIFTGGITVISPNGGESWQAGSSQVITWADNITDDVTIDLYKGGVFHSVISIPTASDGSVDWNMPFTLESGADYTVKITSVDNPGTIFDFSDSDFTIEGNQVTVTSPNGGENWLNSEEQMITWTDNLTGNVEIQLFKNDVFHSSIVTSTPSDGGYTWNIPVSTPSASDYTVKIISVDNGNIFDLSDANFTIIGNELTVDTPNGGESWLTSISQEITWTDDISGDVKIDLYKAGVLDSEIAVATSSDGSYSWIIPGNVATGADYKIRITSLDQPVLFDESNEIFSIFTGEITVGSPNGGESWQAGSSHVITWSDNITEDVSIELYKGGVFHSVISASTESSGSLDWQMPFDLEDGSDYSVRISSAENPNVIYDFADADFTIIANQITVIAPNGSENWQVESTQTIAWNDNIDGNVEIQLFKAGNFLRSISESTASDGIHEWIVPADLEAGSDYMIKVLSVDYLGTYDESNADFTVIANQITLTSPNNGESWKIGSQQIISWVDNLTGNIEIQLFKSGEFHLQIESSISSDNSYTWNIPITLEQASDYKIKILSENDGNICDYSDENFTLLSEIIVGVPNGLEKWQAGTLQNVEWVDNITHNVMIDLYKGGSFHSNISNSVESNGSRQWDIPFNLESGSDYSIKITSATNPDIYDFSDNDFSIEGKVISIMSPSEGDTWQAGTTQEIAWWDNFNENVKIALYKGDEFHSEIDASNGNDGTKFWKIPFVMEQGNDYNIKMKSVDDPNPYKTSADHYFNIVANEITDVSPAGGEKWLIGSVQEIIWSDNLEGDVEILLYKGGLLYTSIASATASDGFYTWTVPQIEQGPDYKIKILSVVTAEVYSESDSNFIITSTIELNDVLSGVPSTYELYQNFPNPFNPSTTIYYGIPKDGPVAIFIYDVLGNQVFQYREENQAAGYHKIDFNATGLASGVYVYRISARLFVETKKMMLIR